MPKKILIVDDDPTSITMANFILRTNNYITVTAADGNEGLVKYGEEKPDLIVLDVQMPNMDGFTFIQELKRLSGPQIPPIIMLTAKEQLQDVFKMEGAVAYFVKPLDTKEFLKKIQQLLNQNP